MTPLLRVPRLRRLRARHAALLLPAATAALALQLTGAPVALALGPLTSPSPQAGSGSPSPTPCPSGLIGTLCQVSGGAPTPPVPASPPPTASPTPAPSSSGGGAGGAAPTPPPSAPGGGPTAAAPGAPGTPGAAAAPAGSGFLQASSLDAAATVARAAANFSNAPFLGSLLDILRNPVSAQRPDLRHFVPGPAAAGASGGATPAGLAALPGPIRPGMPGRATLVALLAAVCAAALLRLPLGRRLLLRVNRALVRVQPAPMTTALLRVRALVESAAGAVGSDLRARLGDRAPAALPRLVRRRFGRHGALAAAAAGVLPVLAALTVTAAAVAAPAATPTGGRDSTAATVASPGAIALRDTTRAGTVAAEAGTATWSQLVGIETGLAAQHDRLAAQESAIRRLAPAVAIHRQDDLAVGVGADSYVQRRNRLEQLVAAHQATAAAYDRTLQAEYTLFRTAAQNPPVRGELLQAAAAAPVPAVRDAVSYDLSLVQTQLTQEQAIAQAEAQLRTTGALTAAQLAAIRQHSPFIAPLSGVMSQPFGPTSFALEPPLTYGGQFFPHFHTGLDIAAPFDTPVHAAADGVVLLATSSIDSSGHLAGYGNYVVIAHPDGFVTLYGHLDRLLVHAGQVVRQGEVIGLEGSTGWSTGPHVHFEIRHNGVFVDPAPFVGSQLS